MDIHLVITLKDGDVEDVDAFAQLPGAPEGKADEDAAECFLNKLNALGLSEDEIEAAAEEGRHEISMWGSIVRWCAAAGK